MAGSNGERYTKMRFEDSFLVKPISSKDAEPLILLEHYAHRRPSITYAFGLFEEHGLIGVCTYGKPLSSTLRTGVCGREYQHLVWELNRLCLQSDKHIKNLASWFIAKTFLFLPKPLVIVSYADTAQNHQGYVYQSLNFLYTGTSAKISDWAIRGEDSLHGCSIRDRVRGKKNQSLLLRELFGDKLYKKKRSIKNRYVLFLGSKSEKKTLRNSLRYKVLEYPKSEVKIGS